MPLHTERAGDCRGSEVDGTRSERWCSLCYVDGAFVDPDCTLAAMTDTVDDALRREHAPDEMRRLAKEQLPTLERWR